MTIGLTLGKFLPFHQGHELLLQTAAASCDRLLVLVGCSDDDPYSFEQRCGWIRKAVESYFPENTLGAGCRISIIEQQELDKNAEKDQFGTITDQKYWDSWLLDTMRLCNKYDVTGIHRVFTSDLYGKRIAEELGAVWYPVDPKREIIPVSGTRVRDDLFSYFQFLPNYVKKDLTKVIAIVGPESTGKSTLTKDLSNRFNCAFVPEYGRTLCEHRKELPEKDFEMIQTVQSAWIENARQRCRSPIVLTDTEGLTTALYHKTYRPDDYHLSYFENAQKQDIDFYVVLYPNVPWVQDGQRVQSEIDRYVYCHSMLEFLRKWKKPYILVDHSEFHMRRAMAINGINTFLENKGVK